MIVNPYLRTQKETLIERKKELGKQRVLNNQAILATGISRNARRYANPDKIDKEALAIVEQAIKDNIEIDTQCHEITERLREFSKQEVDERDKALINLFKEIFEEEQLEELYKESNRRARGEHPFKISFAWKDFYQHKENATKYKKLLIEQLNKMIEFRILLTGLIDKGCEQFGKGDFLKFISPLNRHILPIEELEKIKRKIIG